MMFWLAVAVLSAAVTFVVTRPLLGSSNPADTPAVAEPLAHDAAVYKDQLAEIDADAARGTLTSAEAEAARTEVARRLLRGARARDATQPESTAAAGWIKPIHLITSLALPVASVALYLAHGSPGLPGAPLSQRLAAPPAAQRADDLIAKVEQRLREHPEDGKGWDVIAPVYLARGQFAEAANAFASAMKVLGENPARLQGFASARIRAENGIVPEDARKALQTLVAQDPKLVEPRIWLALAIEQDGKTADAIAEYRSILKSGSAEDTWWGAVQERLSQLENPVQSAPGPSAKPGSTSGAPSGGGAQTPPSADVAGMSVAEREAMIDRMVAGLAARLKQEPKDKDGWQKLIRAYAVLGRKDDAAKALADSKAALAGDQAALAEIDQVAKTLGVGG